MNKNEINHINVEGLSDKDLKMIEDFVELLRKRTEISPIRKNNKGKVIFSAKRSDVIGSLNREEIYDYF